MTLLMTSEAQDKTSIDRSGMCWRYSKGCTSSSRGLNIDEILVSLIIKKYTPVSCHLHLLLGTHRRIGDITCSCFETVPDAMQVSAAEKLAAALNLLIRRHARMWMRNTRHIVKIVITNCAWKKEYFNFSIIFICFVAPKLLVVLKMCHDACTVPLTFVGDSCLRKTMKNHSQR